jgi:rhamnogalacturonyl hydrolase YesR
MIRMLAPAGSRLPLVIGSIVVACQAPSTRVRPDLGSFRDWPERARPEVIGRRVAENYLARPFGFEIGRVPYVVYQEAVTWYGALDFVAAAKDDVLATRLARKFDPFLTTDGARRISPENHVDFDVFGAVPLSLYRTTRDARYLNAGLPLADREWAVPPEAGATARPIAARFWVDDLYMLPTVQLEAYRATNDATYLYRTADLVVAYLDSLQRDNGLFYHGTDAPYFWGRGNGWAAAGLTELLSALPAGHPRRARVLAGYTRMMSALLRYQGRDGLWRELIDHADAWPETSSSAMFTFAFVTGVKRGWLDATAYGPAARRAWLGLVGYLDADANLANVCTGTGKWQPQVGDGVQYYLSRPRLSGASFSTYEELHGLAPMLWAAAAMLR